MITLDERKILASAVTHGTEPAGWTRAGYRPTRTRIRPRTFSKHSR